MTSQIRSRIEYLRQLNRS